MSVYRPKDSRVWHFDFVINKKRYCGSTGVYNRRAAEGVERLKRQEAATGKFGQVASMTLNEASGTWWEEVGRGRGDAADVERRIEVLLTLFPKGITLGELGQAETSRAIQKRRGMTYAKGKDRRDNATGKLIKAKQYPLSESTVNRDVVETLRPILRRARSHWTPTGTPHGLPEIDWRELHLTEPGALVRIYSADERRRWMAACQDDLRLFLDMLWVYGLRFGEPFFPLDAFAADPTEPTLTLQKGRKRDVQLILPLRLDHAAEIAARAGRAQAAGLPHIWFYETKEKGKTVLKAYTPGMVEYRISKAADAAGISGGRRIHGARHHAGSMALRASKGNLKAVQGLLGHASISSSQRYAHVLIDDLRSMIENDIPRDSPEAPVTVDEKTKVR